MIKWGVITRWTVLADGMIHALGGKFRSRRGGPDYGELAAIGLTALVVIAVGWLLSRWLARNDDGKRRFHSRRALFRALCHAHELNHGERRLLRRLARYHRLKNPSRVFLEPEHFQSDQLSPALRQREGELLDLRELLFGPLDEPSRTASS